MSYDAERYAYATERAWDRHSAPDADEAASDEREYTLAEINARARAYAASTAQAPVVGVGRAA
jgi:hypothetical protein